MYRYLEKYPDLEQMFLQEKKMGTDEIVEAARNKLFEGVLNGNERLVMFALRHYDKSGIPGAVDMDSLFSPDVVEAMRSAGIGMSDVVKEFEALVRAQKAMNDA